MLPYFDMIIKIVGIQKIGRDTIFVWNQKTVTQKYLFILFIIFAKAATHLGIRTRVKIGTLWYFKGFENASKMQLFLNAGW